MQTNKTVARVVGVLFIAATAFAVIGDRLLRPIRDDDNYLSTLAEHEGRVIIGALTEVSLAVSVVAIAVLLFPVLKRAGEGSALGYVGVRVLEGAIIIGGAVSSLMLLTLSERYVEVGGEEQDRIEPVGELILAVREWTDALGPSLVFALSALILYPLLFQLQLVPRWLSVWGFIGGAMLVVGAVFALYGESPTSTISIVLAAPIGINEMVLAVWLIIKGFAGPPPSDSVDVRVPEREMIDAY